MEHCKHKHTIRIPNFPGDLMACRDCGEHMNPLGHADGMVRDYYVPGDWWWRRRSEVAKIEWLLQGGDDLEQCPECCFVGTIDDFDVLGADDGKLFCNQCGVEFEIGEPCVIYANEAFVLEG